MDSQADQIKLALENGILLQALGQLIQDLYLSGKQHSTGKIN